MGHKGRAMEVAFSLGSNQGDRLALMRRARAALAGALDADGVEYAPLYETEPVGVKPEYAGITYLNTVIVLQSDRSPQEWMDALQEIEHRLGRVRTEDRYAPRTVDIDLIYAGETVIETQPLHLPHPRWMQRRYVLQPLADLRPERVLPGAGGRTVRELLDDLGAGEAVWVWREDW